MKNRLQYWLKCGKNCHRANKAIVCFTYAGGSASFCSSWESMLNIGICAIQFPGIEERRATLHTQRWNDMVRLTCDALMLLVNSCPYYLFGHSFGGLVAFEVARELRRRAAPQPIRLIVSGRTAPSLGAIYPLFHLSDSALLPKLIRLDPEQQAPLRRPEIYRALLPQLRADLELCDHYVYQAESPLEVPITAFAGRLDPVATPERIQPWQQETSASFTSHLFDGGHFFIKSAKRQFLQALRDELKRTPISADVTP